MPLTTEVVQQKCVDALFLIKNATHEAEKNKTSDSANLVVLLQLVEFEMIPQLLTIAEYMTEFDLNAETPGNGYRSLVGITLKYLRKAGKVMSHVVLKHHTALKLQPKTAALKEIIALLSAQNTVLGFAVECHAMSGPDKRLIVQSESCFDLMDRFRALDKRPYYGVNYALAFDGVLRTLYEAMVTFSASFAANRGIFNKNVPVLTGLSTVIIAPVYSMDAHARAKRCVKQFESHNVNFLRNFWNVTEANIFNNVIQAQATKVGASSVFYLSCRNPINLRYEDCEAQEGDELTPDSTSTERVVHVKAPNIRKKRIQIRVVRTEASSGRIKFGIKDVIKHKAGRKPIVWSSGAAPPTDCDEDDEAAEVFDSADSRTGILFHVHGGGFVAQTSRSHASYLKRWTKELGILVLSVDYSLAPKNPYPTALEECFFAYAWVLQHASAMGYPSSNICLSGDSAGGNLVVALGLRIAQEGLPMPCAIQATYPALAIRMLPSPARLLSAGDVCLPLGIMEDCLDAYSPGGGVGSGAAGVNPEFRREEVDPLLSPWHCSDAMLKTLPPVYMVTGAYDPLHDDCIDFARRLRAVGNEVHVSVFDKVSHAFLQFADIAGGATEAAADQVMEHLRLMFERFSGSEVRNTARVVQHQFQVGWMETQVEPDEGLSSDG